LAEKEKKVYSAETIEESNNSTSLEEKPDKQ